MPLIEFVCRDLTPLQGLFTSIQFFLLSIALAGQREQTLLFSCSFKYNHGLPIAVRVHIHIEIQKMKERASAGDLTTILKTLAYK